MPPGAERDREGDEAPAPAAEFAELGVLLIDAGLSVTDVRTSLESAHAATGTAEAMSFAVLPSAVFISLDDEGGRTVMGNTTSEALSIRQAARAMRLLHRVVDGSVPLAGIHGHARGIRAFLPRHRVIAWIGGTALVAFGLAVLFRCPWWAVVTSAVAGVVVGAITAVLRRSGAASSIMPFVAAFASTLLVGGVAAWLGTGAVPLFAVCAPIAILVPGALITNALLELSATDIVTGSARLAYGLIVLGFMTVGILAGGAVTGLTVDPDSAALVGQAVTLQSPPGGWTALPPPWVSWVGVVVLAAGVGLAFGAGRRLIVLSILVMVCTYAALAGLTPFVGSVLATGITAAALFVAARMLEHLSFGVPAATTFQPAFLLLVPGTVGLVALATLDRGSLESALLVFASLCIGTKAGSVVVDTPWSRVLARRHPRVRKRGGAPLDGGTAAR
ncbi:MAG: threonine/serine exporter family protein [Microbacterium sp.]|uniref:threonine/serine exporter family protein n=1 Tax=Microbacterium sp. TaxID=51671 RepID=UPI003F7F0B14